MKKINKNIKDVPYSYLQILKLFLYIHIYKFWNFFYVFVSTFFYIIHIYIIYIIHIYIIQSLKFILIYLIS